MRKHHGPIHVPQKSSRDFTDSVGACDLACIRATMWLPQGASNRQAANEAFKASSYGQTEYDEATSDVIRVTINENVGDNYSSSCGTDSLADKAEALATTAGYRSSDYHHTVFYIPSDFGGGECGWGGLAQSPGSRVWMRVGYGRWYFLEHELGHNRKLELGSKPPSPPLTVPFTPSHPTSSPEGFRRPPKKCHSTYCCLLTRCLVYSFSRSRAQPRRNRRRR